MQATRIPSALRTRAMTLGLALLLIGAGFGARSLQPGDAGASPAQSQRRTTPIVEAVQHAAPAVVSVYADSRSRRGVRRRGAGSGVIVHPAGYIVTNSHVIRGGQQFTVKLFNGNGTYPAQVVVNDPGRDLALLKINVPTARLRYVSIAPTRRVMLGETAIAVGNPHGLGDTITVGVISALGRDAKMSTGAVLRNLIQTDASINTGNSGGALLNLDGELIGIIVSLLPRASGIAFAIPGEQVDALVRGALKTSLPSNGLIDRTPPAVAPAPDTQADPRVGQPRVGRPSLARRDAQDPAMRGLPDPRVSAGRPGIRPGPGAAPESSKPLTSPLHPTDFGLDIYDTGSDLRVRHISSGSAGQRAGMRSGDILLTIDGSPVEDRTDLLLAFSRSRPGQDYYVGLRRSGVRKYVILTVPR